MIISTNEKILTLMDRKIEQTYPTCYSTILSILRCRNTPQFFVNLNFLSQNTVQPHFITTSILRPLYYNDHILSDRFQYFLNI